MSYVPTTKYAFSSTQTVSNSSIYTAPITVINPAYLKISTLMSTNGGEATLVGIGAFRAITDMGVLLSNWQQDFTLRSLPRLWALTYKQLAQDEAHYQITTKGIMHGGAAYLAYMYCWNVQNIVALDSVRLVTYTIFAVCNYIVNYLPL